jgi:hypothetical protein
VTGCLGALWRVRGGGSVFKVSSVAVARPNSRGTLRHVCVCVCGGAVLCIGGVTGHLGAFNRLNRTVTRPCCLHGKVHRRADRGGGGGGW